MDAIRLRDEGKTYTEIIVETGLARSRVSRILNKQRIWFERANALDESDLEAPADRSPENIG
ncbi:hypothetical protein [Haloarcula brevis]|uniref:hypothetical protein n=1 Tax=Haloarcula brevis TaxID=3111453 RepID=UPI00300E9CD3